MNSFPKEIKANLSNVLIGKDEVIEQLLITFLSGGHLLLEDVPGVGKTTLAKSFAKFLNLSFGRIQCTPDTMPGDITGIMIYQPSTGEFSYQQGVIQNNILLADELNRATPKTQAALLEAMEEGTITIDRNTYALPAPFMVIATQNPIESVGTYPLPEAQLDRFFMKCTIGYPSMDDELIMLSGKLRDETAFQPKAASSFSKENLEECFKEIQNVTIHPDLLKYAATIVNATRKNKQIVLGASPRALIAFCKAARAKAYLEDRTYVLPQDMKSLAVPVLAHRIKLSYQALGEKMTAEKFIQKILSETPVPTIN